MNGYTYKYKIIIICLILGVANIPITSLGDVLRDPTQPATHKGTFTTKISANNIKISAIFAGKNNNSVIINNHSFVIGDKIAGLTITAIDKDGILLQNKEGSELRVTMSYSTVKSPTTDKKGRKK